jgi:Methyltransferase domain
MKRDETWRRPAFLTVSLFIIVAVVAIFATAPLSLPDNRLLPFPVHCARSLRESYNFFCETDASWDRRRAIIDAQQPNQIVHVHDRAFKAKTARWWQDNYEPNFSCTFERRLGRPGDGGKWGTMTRSPSDAILVLNPFTAFLGSLTPC